MKQNATGRINGVFSGLRGQPLRIVFRRHVNHKWDRYDVFLPYSKIEGVVEVLKQLDKEQENFTQSIVEVDKKYLRSTPGRTNRYVDTDQNNLYTRHRTDLIRKRSVRVGKLWLADDLNTPQMLTVIREACDAAQVVFGSASALKW